MHMTPPIELLESRRLLADPNALVAELAPGALHANPLELTVAGDYLYFLVQHVPTQAVVGARWEVYRTDGTARATVQMTSHDGLTPGSQLPIDRAHQALSFYYGARSLLAIGDDLWFYDVNHNSAQIIEVSLCRMRPGGTVQRWELGSFNLSLGQTLHDLHNVGGQVHFYRDPEWWSADLDVAEGSWWRISTGGTLVDTGITDPDAFGGTRSAYGTSAMFKGKRFYAGDDGSGGRELWSWDPQQAFSLDSAGVLRVHATKGDDKINIYRSPSKPQRLVVDVDGYQRVYDLNRVSRIRVDADSGNDYAALIEKYAPIHIGASLLGGAGNDTLIGASGRDTLYGGDGNDALYGGGERDWLFGEAGNDRLVGGGAYDILWGGEGSDTFVSSVARERRDAGDDDRFI